MYRNRSNYASFEIFSTKRCFYNDDCNRQSDAHLKVLLRVAEEGEEEEEEGS